MPTIDNQLIERLPRKDRLRLLAICEPVELELSDVLGERGRPTRHVYFPTGAFVSLVTPLGGKPVLEVGMVGHEGMLGVQIVLGVSIAPLHALVQGAGSAWCVGTGPFRRELARSVALRRGLERYVYVLMQQLASSVACVRFHTIDARLARWLLMTQDRARTDRFRVTHEFLAYMLGVRRVGITVAAGALQGKKLIKYHRGELHVVNRAGLEVAACHCYASDRDVYAQLLE